MKELRSYQQKAINECWQALRENDAPVLLMASVGAGKSLMLASILLTMEKSGKRALCLVNNAELVRNNCATFINYGGKASIYCATIGQKDINNSIIFGTPQSVLNAINKKEAISYILFNIIIVDEAHMINHINDKSCFMQILRHYKQNYKEMRLLGATGTNFRYKGSEIVGNKCLFKTQVGNITTEKLIADGYLIKPTFEIDSNLIIDFSKVRIKQNGVFDYKDLENVVSNNTRLTKLICMQIIHIMNNQNRFGVFIFATTKKHAQEILSYLPRDEAAIILGETSYERRHKILEEARCGKIRYLVNIAIISVGVDVPGYDTLAYLRPTESLVLLIQTMGRVLRMSESTNKNSALILDFAGNIERHRDWDNPILLDAIKSTLDKDKPLIFECPECLTMNSEYSRRCVGMQNDARCNYYFQFRECPRCQSKNDIVKRYCIECDFELIDPNNKLSIKKIDKIIKEVYVIESKYSISGSPSGFKINCSYQFQDNNQIKGIVFESFSITNKKSKDIFYANFIKKHCDKPSQWYPYLSNFFKMRQMIKTISSPILLKLVIDSNKYKIYEKIFENNEDS